MNSTSEDFPDLAESLVVGLFYIFDAEKSTGK